MNKHLKELYRPSIDGIETSMVTTPMFSPEEKKAADESAGKLSSLHQMMIILHNSMKICNEPYDYNLVFNKNKGDALLKGYEVFEPYGWYFEDEEERQVLDGTSELYRKEKKE